MPIKNCRSVRPFYVAIALAILVQGQFCRGQAIPAPRSEEVSPFLSSGLSPLDKLSKNMEAIAKVAGWEPGLQQYLTLVPELFDRTRPIGFFGFWGLTDNPFGSPTFDPVLMLPIKNGEKLLTHLRDVGMIEQLDEKAGIWTFQASLFSFSAIEKNGWLVVVAKQAVDFTKLPVHLDRLLLPFQERFDLFLSISPMQIPLVIRDRVVKEAKQPLGYGNPIQGEPAIKTASELLFEKELEERLQNWLTDMNSFTVGLELTNPDKKMSMELITQFDPDSKASREFSHMTELPSLFNKFGVEQESMRSSWKIRLPTFVANFAINRFKEQAEQIELDFVSVGDALGLSAASKKVIFDEAKAMYLRTFESGNLDALFLAGEKQSESITMIRMVEPKKVETILRELQKALRLKPELGKVDMDVAKHKGVTMHLIVLKTKGFAGNERIAKGNILFDELRIGVGVSKEVLMIATGASPVTELTRALDNTQKGTFGKNNNDAIYFSEFRVSQILYGFGGTAESSATSITDPDEKLNDRLKCELRKTPEGLKGQIEMDIGAFDWLVNRFPKIAEEQMASIVKRSEAPFPNPGELNPSSPLPKKAEKTSPAPRPRSNQNRSNQVAQSENKYTEVAKFSDLTWGVKGLDFSPDGKFLAAGKPDQMVVMLDVPGKSQASSKDKLAALGSAQICMFTPDGKKLVVGGQSGEILVFSVAKNGSLKQIAEFSGHSREIQSLAISEDGKNALSGDQAKKAFYWEIESGNILSNISGFDGPIKAIHLGSKGRHAYLTDGSKLIEYDLGKKKVVNERRLTNTWASGQAAAFSPNGEYVAAGDTYDIRLWNLKTGKELPRLMHKEIQWSMQFTPNGEKLLCGGSGLVNAWDVSSSRLESSQTVGSMVYVHSLAISRDGKQFAAPSNNEVRVFQLK